MNPPATLVRTSEVRDLAAITAIYAESVAHGSGTFEIEAPTASELARRRDAVLGHGLPWLVVEQDGRVAGWACASPFRPRPAYRFCVEDSVYVAAAAQGRGLGRLLLAELVARCEARGMRQMLALIGDSANHASIALHRGVGFRPAGVLDASGWKFERWLDVVILQRALGPGRGTPPLERPA